jgi:predicted MPP superfamily phosphohydrolase
MSGMLLAVALLVFALMWIGHACLWTALLNRVYGRPLPKYFLKAWRYLTGIIIAAFPILLAVAFPERVFKIYEAEQRFFDEPGALAIRVYAAACLVVGGIVFPVITIARLWSVPPGCVVSQTTRSFDLWAEYGAKLIGDGKFAVATRIPGNCVFHVEFTHITLALPDLPPEWEELTILVANDFHFHGTPSRLFFERVIDEITLGPAPDVLCLLGDFVDTDAHHEWVGPLLGRLGARGEKFAILGNHDQHYQPEHLRRELAACGYTVLGNRWVETTIRGVACVVVGHEGPWFRPPPDLSGAPEGFRLCLSHTPDNFYWGIANRIQLMLCGHVHGGAIRLPAVGSIFVPSIYGRRFDQGVFERDGTTMVVNRGLSGREPIRFRCNPQVLRVKLVRRGDSLR